MKKFFLLLLISMAFIACSAPSDMITTEAFIENLNSFDSTATYEYVGSDYRVFQFAIKQNDSLFIYNVERTSFSKFIYMSKFAKDKVK